MKLMLLIALCISFSLHAMRFPSMSSIGNQIRIPQSAMAMQPSLTKKVNLGQTIDLQKDLKEGQIGELESEVKALDVKPREDKISSILLTNLMHGIKLHLYQTMILFSFHTVFSRNVPSFYKNLPRQFEEEPSFFESVVVDPIIEELFFTHFLAAGLGKFGQFIVPFIFGAAHHHQNIRMWLICGLHTALMNFLHIKHMKNNPDIRLAPIISHMLNNLIAHIYSTKKNN